MCDLALKISPEIVHVGHVLQRFRRLGHQICDTWAQKVLKMLSAARLNEVDCIIMAVKDDILHLVELAALMEVRDSA